MVTDHEVQEIQGVAGFPWHAPKTGVGRDSKIQMTSSIMVRSLSQGTGCSLGRNPKLTLTPERGYIVTCGC